MEDLAVGVYEGAAVEWTQGGQVYHGCLLWIGEEGWATVEEDGGQLVAVPAVMLRPWAPVGQLRLI